MAVLFGSHQILLKTLGRFPRYLKYISHQKGKNHAIPTADSN